MRTRSNVSSSQARHWIVRSLVDENECSVHNGPASRQSISPIQVRFDSDLVYNMPPETKWAVIEFGSLSNLSILVVEVKIISCFKQLLCFVISQVTLNNTNSFPGFVVGAAGFQ